MGTSPFNLQNRKKKKKKKKKKKTLKSARGAVTWPSRLSILLLIVYCMPGGALT